jgi:hypothetical protein
MLQQNIQVPQAAPPRVASATPPWPNPYGALMGQAAAFPGGAQGFPMDPAAFAQAQIPYGAGQPPLDSEKESYD